MWIPLVIYWMRFYRDDSGMWNLNIYITTAVLMLLIITGIVTTTAEAAEDGYEIAGGIGMSLNDLGSTEGIVLGAWIKRLSKTVDLRIEPNAEVIVARTGHSLFLGGVSPVLRLGVQGKRLNPFLDAGVGVSIGSRTTLLNRDFGSSFFFSPTAGAGIKFGKTTGGVSFFVRWVHHSNAGLFQPNEGIDSLYALFAYRF
jgi:hypothetical protein